MNAVGGYAMNRWRFGAGVHFRRNLFHSSSYQGNSGQGFGSSKGATTFGALLDLGYHYPLLDDFDIILSFGAGYGVSVVQDSLSGDSRYDPTSLLLPGSGGKYAPLGLVMGTTAGEGMEVFLNGASKEELPSCP